tara:strand:- start:1059 stop:1304 length:246 start_codon:yes stop_codon:yes gene_type:complete
MCGRGTPDLRTGGAPEEVLAATLRRFPFRNILATNFTDQGNTGVHGEALVGIYQISAPLAVFVAHRKKSGSLSIFLDRPPE